MDLYQTRKFHTSHAFSVTQKLMHILAKLSLLLKLSKLLDATWLYIF